MMMWNYIGGGLFMFSLLAGAFAINTFIRALVSKDAGMRLASKRSGLLAVACVGLGFLIMNTLAEQRPTEKEIETASEFVQSLEKQK
jgi:hypothetical protein